MTNPTITTGLDANAETLREIYADLTCLADDADEAIVLHRAAGSQVISRWLARPPSRSTSTS